MATLTQLDVNTDLGEVREIGCTTRGSDASHKVKFVISRDYNNPAEYLVEYEGDSLVAIYTVSEMEHLPHITDLVTQLLTGGLISDDDPDNTVP